MTGRQEGLCASCVLLDACNMSRACTPAGRRASSPACSTTCRTGPTRLCHRLWHRVRHDGEATPPACPKLAWLAHARHLPGTPLQPGAARCHPALARTPREAQVYVAVRELLPTAFRFDPKDQLVSLSEWRSSEQAAPKATAAVAPAEACPRQGERLWQHSACPAPPCRPRASSRPSRPPNAPTQACW